MNSTYTDSRLINISSGSADSLMNGTLLSSCVFGFPGLLKDEQDILYTQISLLNAQIPISYYIINEYNNKLSYQIETDGIQTAYFEYGNYNANSFITEFKAKVGTHFNLTLNRINGKYTVTNNKTFEFYYQDSTIFKIMGLDTGSDVLAPLKTYTAPYPCNFAGITRIKIISNELSTYAMDSVTGNFSNLLTSISVNSGSYGILLYENNHNFKALLRNKNIDYFDIGFLDDDENYIDFNNINWHMTLQIDIVRKLRDNDTQLQLNPPEINYNMEQEEQQDQPQEEQNIEPLQNSTGDDDLDFLMYQNGIYQ